MRPVTVLLALMFFSGCSGMQMGKPAVTEMPLSERDALECKYQLAQIGRVIYDPESLEYASERVRRRFEERAKQPLTRRDLEPHLGGQCPTGKVASYRDSLLANVGKRRQEAIIFCSGEHHQKAGYATDYPRWIAGVGVVEEPSGVNLIPSGCDLPLPKDAKILSSHSRPRSGNVEMVFSTSEDIEALAERYHKLLNAGADFVQASQSGSYAVGGELHHISYNINLEVDTQTVLVRWDPIIHDDRAEP